MFRSVCAMQLATDLPFGTVGDFELRNAGGSRIPNDKLSVCQRRSNGKVGRSSLTPQWSLPTFGNRPPAVDGGRK